MKIFASEYYLQKLKKKSARRSDLENKIKKKLELFQQDQDYPSLRTNKLTGDQRDPWSIAIEDNLLLIFIYIPNGILLINLGSHNEVY